MELKQKAIVQVLRFFHRVLKNYLKKKPNTPS
mgnify:CR=1 FL=1